MKVNTNMSNMNDVLTAFLVDADGSEAREMDIVNNLECFQRDLGAKYVRIQNIYVGGHRLKMVCPPDALTNEKRHACACDSEGRTVVYGKMLLLGALRENDADMLVSLDDDEMSAIRRDLGMMTIEMDDHSVYNSYCLCNVSLKPVGKVTERTADKGDGKKDDKDKEKGGLKGWLRK